MPTPPNAHVRKRQYQPSLESYFNRNGAGRNSRSPMSPPLPVETQASLLNVGMRVRKSVPEGYKTHKTLGSPAFPFPSSAPVPSATLLGSQSRTGSSRELMPFCGLHKTGGWAEQEIPPSSAPALLQRLTEGDDGDDDDNEDEDGMPDLTLSQSTTSSTQFNFTPRTTRTVNDNKKKRTYEEEAEDDIDAFFDELDDADSRKYQESDTVRPIARIRSSAARGSRSTAHQTSSSLVGGSDFEEATFLTPMDVDR